MQIDVYVHGPQQLVADMSIKRWAGDLLMMSMERLNDDQEGAFTVVLAQVRTEADLSELDLLMIKAGYGCALIHNLSWGY